MKKRKSKRIEPECNINMEETAFQYNMPVMKVIVKIGAKTIMIKTKIKKKQSVYSFGDWWEWG